MTIKARILKGFKDYLPEEMIERERIIEKIKKTFENYGFNPLMTPTIEYSDILLGKYGEEGDMLLYRFRDNGNRDVALRYDLTVPLARFYAMNRNLPKPFKRYQIAPVFRAEKPAKGRFREFFQCDADIVGTESVVADYECTALGVDILLNLGISNFKIHINSRKILDGIAFVLNIKRFEEFVRILDKIDKVGEERVFSMLSEAEIVDDKGLKKLREILSYSLSDFKGLFHGKDEYLNGVLRVEEIFELHRAIGTDKFLKFNPKMARGLDYYTDTIYETFITGNENFGSVMSGGRYDNLIGIFLNQKVPAVGISVGIDRLFSLLKEDGKIELKKDIAKVLVLNFSTETLKKSLSFTRKLRLSGINTTFYYESKKIKKQFSLADKLNIPFVVIIGEDEAKAGKVKIKDMSSHQELLFSEEEAVKFLMKN